MSQDSASNRPEDALRGGFSENLARIGGGASATCFVLIALLVLGQVCLNIVNSAGAQFMGTRYGLQIPSYSEFTGYLFAGGSFLGFPYAFQKSAHIRVELLVQRFRPILRRNLELWSLFLAGVISTVFASYLLIMVLDSQRYHDTSMGQIALPLWMPQVPLFAGMSIFAIVIWDAYRLALLEFPRPLESPHVRLQALLALGLITSLLSAWFGYFDALSAVREITRGSSLMLLSLVVGGSMLLALASGLWVAFSLLLSALIAMALFSGTLVGGNLALQSWGAVNSWSLASLPLFIWMGEILFRSRISKDLFEGFAPLLFRLPGGLVHVGILASGLFAAISGSSAATAATIGKVTIPRLLERGYDERLVIGVVAGSGTLGLLIPPSVILIVYGVATEQSISRLFAGGILPGLTLIAIFMAYVIGRSVFLSRANAGNTTATAPLGERPRLKDSLRLLPVVAIIATIFGVIYSGWASPTDAAAIGVLMSLIFALVTDWTEGRRSLAIYVDGLFGAVKTSGMIVLIYIGASFLTVAMGYTGIPNSLALWIASMEMGPTTLLVALTIFFAILGCFLDGVSIVLLTTAVLIPVIEQAGFDLIWFGIYLVFVVEMSQITPPVGFNLFVLQGITGRDILYITRAAMPFFLLLVLLIAIIYVFPEIVTYLPNRMG